MLEYIFCHGGPAEHWGLLPATRLASREILIEQNIKKHTGPSLCVLCGCKTSAPDYCILNSICGPPPRYDALTKRPPTKRPVNILPQTKCPLNISPQVTFCPSDIWTFMGWIVHPPFTPSFLP